MISSEDLFAQDGVSAQDQRGFQIISGVANTYKLLRNPFLETDTAIELMSALSWDPELTAAWIKRMRAVGPSLFDAPEVMRAWKDEMYVAMTARLNTLDDISRAACLNYAQEAWMTWDDINPYVFLRPFQIGNGTLVHVSGVMGSGKTDMACLIAEYALDAGFVVATNIAFEGDLPDNLKRCVRLSDLLLEMIEARLRGDDVVVFFDEVSQFFSRREAGKSQNIQLEKLLRLTRKFRTNIVFIEQVKGGLPGVALELLTGRFHKIGRKKVQYATRNMEKNYNLLLDSVPKTKLPFRTLHLGGFKADIDLGELFANTLIEEEQEIALRRAILEAQEENRRR